jgi:hypothetical protein
MFLVEKLCSVSFIPTYLCHQEYVMAQDTSPLSSCPAYLRQRAKYNQVSNHDGKNKIFLVEK